MLSLPIGLAINHLEGRHPSRRLNRPSYLLVTRHLNPACNHLVARQFNLPTFQVLNLRIGLAISHLEGPHSNRLLSHPCFHLVTQQLNPACNHQVARQANLPTFQVLSLLISLAICHPEDRLPNRLINRPSYLLVTRQPNPACDHLVARRGSLPVSQVANLPINLAISHLEVRHFNRLLNHPSYLLVGQQHYQAHNHLVAQQVSLPKFQVHDLPTGLVTTHPDGRLLNHHHSRPRYQLASRQPYPAHNHLVAQQGNL